MKAKAYNLRALGYSRLGTRNDPLPVPEVRYIVTNGRGRISRHGWAISLVQERRMT